MDTKDKIAIALKEYDALRKEIDLRTDATKTYGWPVVLLAVGTIASWKTNLDINVVLLFIPTIVMTIFALATNANHDIEKYRCALVRTEKKVNILAGERILDYEKLEQIRKRKSPANMRYAGFGITFTYVAIELLFFRSFGIDRIMECLARDSGNPAGTEIIYDLAIGLVLIVPAVIYLRNILEWADLINKIVYED